MNWALMYNGAWDYPADTRGYTWGGVAELNQPNYALRFGFFCRADDSERPDYRRSTDQRPRTSVGMGATLRTPGAARPGPMDGVLDRSRAGNYHEALDLSQQLGIDPNVAMDLTRSYSSRKIRLHA